MGKSLVFFTHGVYPPGHTVRFRVIGLLLRVTVELVTNRARIKG